MSKVIIVTNKILPYRKDFYEKLGLRLNLSVAHYGELQSAENFRCLSYTRKSFSGFYSLTGLFNHIVNENYDRVICIFDLRFLGLYHILFSKLRSKTLLWGIGISSKSGLKEKRVLDKIRISIANRSNGIILYSKKVASIYRKNNFGKNIYVATNSAQVETFDFDQFDFIESSNFIFVGSLDIRKGIHVFLTAFSEYIAVNDEFKSIVNIVGDGTQRIYLEQLVINMGLSKRVFFHGKITDSKLLAELYSKSVMSFSINQAGLSVLQSLGYGVPFLSSKNAITGGELFNIVDGETGFILNSTDDEGKKNEIKKILKLVYEKPNSIIAMREKCSKYYDTSASLDLMCDVFVKAISK